MFAYMFKHFGLWNPNGWPDWDGRIFVRCAGAAGRRRCRLQTDRLHVAGATFNLAKVAKSIGTRCRPNQWTDSAQTWWANSCHAGCGPLGVSMVVPPSHVWEARDTWFHFFVLCAGTAGPIVAGKTLLYSKRRQWDCQVTCRFLKSMLWPCVWIPTMPRR